MRRIMMVLSIILFVHILMPSVKKEVRAGELAGEFTEELMEVEDYDLSDIQNVIDETEYRELNFMDMVKEFISGESDTVLVDTFKYMLQKVFSDINLGKECISNIILIAIVSAFFSNFTKIFNQNNVSDTGFFICYIAVMTVLITMFGTASKIAINLLELILNFMQALVPAFFLSVGIVGQASAVGFYQITLCTIYVVDYLLLNIIVPILKVYLVLSLANNISREDILSKAIELMKKAIVFLNRTLLGGVVGINVIQGLVLPQVDGLKNTTIKKLVGSLPVVGDSSDYVTNIFLGSGMLIKNSMGTVAIVVLLCICFVPIVKIFLLMVSLSISAAVIQPITDRRIIQSIGCVSDGINLLLRTVITATFLFIISIAIVCLVTKI